MEFCKLCCAYKLLIPYAASLGIYSLTWEQHWYILHIYTTQEVPRSQWCPVYSPHKRLIMLKTFPYHATSWKYLCPNLMQGHACLYRLTYFSLDVPIVNFPSSISFVYLSRVGLKLKYVSKRGLWLNNFNQNGSKPRFPTVSTASSRSHEMRPWVVDTLRPR